MTIRFKITRRLLQTIRRDLDRPHKFAHERVGFVSASASASRGHLCILAREYRPVADNDYAPDLSVGAMMGPEAIRKALQWAMNEHVSIFHIHSHGGVGIPTFSQIDNREQAKFVPSFFQLAPQSTHGSLVLSNDAAFGNVWRGDGAPSEAITEFVEVGAPICTWSIR
jgi:proteasome lid subunit RPN8/RPN11